jgi:hypothetical protein
VPLSSDLDPAEARLLRRLVEDADGDGGTRGDDGLAREYVPALRVRECILAGLELPADGRGLRDVAAVEERDERGDLRGAPACGGEEREIRRSGS